MCQAEMIQAGIQIEAGRELRELAQPLIHKIIHGVRSRWLTNNAPEAAQPDVTLQSLKDTRTGRIQVREG